MVTLTGGSIALVLGIIGLFAWWGEFIELIMGALPIMLVLGGALAAYLGLEELKDQKTAEAFDSTTESLQSEVETLKEENKKLQEEKEKMEKELSDTEENK